MDTKARIIFMFSGQGSQYYQMGKELLDNHVFSHWMQQGAEILASLGQPSFLTALYENQTREAWNNLLLTHPGLVIIEYAVFQVLKSLGVVPDAVLGFSVGEFSAAAVAEILTFEEALTAAYEQAKLVSNLCSKGGMTAVLSSPEVYSQLKEHVHLGGVNYDQHFLITGSSDGLREAHRILKSLNKTFISLPVDYPFHSEKIKAAQAPFEQYCQTNIYLKHPKISLISGKTGLLLTKVPNSYFWDVVYQPLPFQHVISHLETQGKTLYVDLGPSGTLATFVKYNLAQTSQSSGIALLTPFHNGKKNIEQLLICLKEEKLS
jgi:bacillaene synthase trans-acting acyltransferase